MPYAIAREDFEAQYNFGPVKVKAGELLLGDAAAWFLSQGLPVDEVSEAADGSPDLSSGSASKPRRATGV